MKVRAQRLSISFQHFSACVCILLDSIFTEILDTLWKYKIGRRFHIKYDDINHQSFISKFLCCDCRLEKPENSMYTMYNINLKYIQALYTNELYIE